MSATTAIEWLLVALGAVMFTLIAALVATIIVSIWRFRP